MFKIDNYDNNDDIDKNHLIIKISSSDIYFFISSTFKWDFLIYSLLVISFDSNASFNSFSFYFTIGYSKKFSFRIFTTHSNIVKSEWFDQYYFFFLWSKDLACAAVFVPINSAILNRFDNFWNSSSKYIRYFFFNLKIKVLFMLVYKNN